MKVLRALLPIIFLLTGCSSNNSEAVAESAVKQHYLLQYTKVQDDQERLRHLDVGYFAGGCFWGVQDEFNRAPGVVSTIVGYCGGVTKYPTYESVCRHGTKHAETVRVVYDPGKTSFKSLTGYFLDRHDPTTVNRQGPDVGDQYRSAIFFEGVKQKEEALQAIESKNAKLPKGISVVTTLNKFEAFYTAEDYHQNYISRTGDASCHVR